MKVLRAHFRQLFTLGLISATVTLPPAVANAQVRPPEVPSVVENDPLVPVRESMAQAQWLEAWRLLAKVPRSNAALDLKVEVALQLQRPEDALTAWKLLWENGAGDEALKRIATYSARRLLESTDALIRLESERLLATLGEKDARTRLQRQADSPQESPLERAGAAAALAAAGDAGAVSKFVTLSQSVPERDRFNLIRLVPSMPDEVALKLLAPMLKSPRPDVRYGAVLALGDRRGPAVLRILRDFLASSPEGAGRLAAMLALAVQGDRQMLGELGKLAPYFGDREKLEYARALLAAGDSQGNRFLGMVQNSDDELLRLEAAAVVAKASPATGRDLLVGALGSPTLWVRLRALELLRAVPPQPNAFAHLLVAAEEWIRLRSAELVLASQPTAPPRRGARP